MTWRNKRGFTLIETVICVGLISILAVAFSLVMVSSLRSNSAANSYDEKTAALLTQLAEGAVTPSTVTAGTDMVNAEQKEVTLDLGNGSTMTVQKWEYRYSGDANGVKYYAYVAP